ncbi:PAS domain S-box protein [Aquiflexum gelatinilyticum]|uniref:PAS domain S-box protein n=1 Tax=Aquiflexum gelatinilyticum TaxID=2961943 RepID=UPI0021690A0D|nr:PAS domain S-box protein [Aquiflexum gelatinilyticum]MCS4433018.1 PAS domain S-box protein [Aquiflexum gelatinilyticum]
MVIDAMTNNLFSLNPIPSWIFDFETQEILEVNIAAIHHYGYSRKEFLSMTLKDIHPKKEILEINAGRDQPEGNINFGVFTHQKKSGELIRMEINANKVDYFDRPCMLAVCLDVTEKENQVLELKRTEEKLKSISSMAKIGYWRLEIDGKTLTWTDEVYNIWSRDKNSFEVNFENFRSSIHPDDLQGLMKEQDDAFSGEKELDYIHRIILPDKSIKWVHELGRLIKDENGKPIAFEGTVQDITRQKAEEQRLKLLESVITHTNDAVLITEAELFDEPGPRIIYVNEAFTKMTGYTSEEVIGKSPRILQGPNSDREELAVLSKSIRNWQPYEITTINYKKNGEEFWINFSVIPVANEKGWYTHWIAIERDVTEQKNKELEKDLINTISDIFHQSIDNDLTKCLSNLCEHIIKIGDFDLSEIWLPAIDGKSINRVAHHAKGITGSTFYQATKQITSCALGEGLPGNVWQNKTIEIWGNVEGEWLIKRKLAAKKAGFEAMMGVPLKNKDEVIGVLLLGTVKPKSALTPYIDLLRKLESAIGSELSKKKVEIELAQIFDFTPDLICMAGFDGYIKRINPAGLALLGYTLEEICSRPIISFLHEQDRLLTSDAQLKLYNGENIRNFENRYVTKQGKVIWLSWTSTSSPEQGVVYAVAKNITEEKNLRELNRQVGKLAKIGSWEFDAVNNTIFWSDEVHQIYGTDPKSFVPNVEAAFNFYREDYRHLARSSFEKCILTQQPYTIEAVIVTSGNKELWVRTTAKAEFMDGVCTRVYGSFQDIHDFKMSGIAMAESEARFRTIFEIATLGIAQVDPSNGQIILVNSYYESITGYSKSELLNMKFPDLTHPEDKEKDWKIFSKAALGEGEYRNEKRYVKKDGSVVWVRLHVAFIRDNMGKPVRTVAICEDITDRKAAELRHQSLADNLPGVVFQYLLFPDGTDALRNVSKGSKKIWEYSPEEVMDDVHLVWNQTKAGGDFNQVRQSILDSVKNRSKWTARYRTVSPSGERRTLQGLGSPDFLPDGTVLFNSMVMDITREVENEELLRQATSMAKIGSWEIDLHRGKIFWSDMVHELHETDPNSYELDWETAIHFYREDFHEVVTEKVSKCIEKGESFDFEAVIVTATRKERWVRVIGIGEFIEGKCQRIFGSFQDIDLPKSLELQILEILESISDPFYAVDEHWNLTYFNTEAENLLKRKSGGKFNKENFWEVFPQGEETGLKTKLESVAKSKAAKTFEYNYPVDGKWYEITAYPSKGGVSAFFKNIDDRIKAEEGLKKAFQEKNNIIESIADAFFTMDSGCIVSYWNHAAEKLLGVKREEIIGRNLWDLFPDAVTHPSYINYHRVLETGEAVHFEDNFGKWLEVDAYPSEEGITVFFRDISLRKEADFRLLEANERFEKVTEATNDAIWDFDAVNNTLFWGKGFFTLFGYNPDEINPTFELLMSCIHIEDRERIINKVNRFMSDPELKDWYEEYRFLKNDHTIAFVIDRATFIRNSEGKVIRVIGAMNDITERKNSELQLLSLNESLQKYAKELERSNEELEQFAFVTSHDLQEPLRMISSFMDLLKRKYGSQLDEKAIQYIHFAIDGAKRMKQIILELLEYSRASVSSEGKELVDLNEILDEYKKLRRTVISEKSVSISYQPLPSLTTYSAGITQVLHALLDNAIKYSKEDVPPQIDIHSIEKEKEWEFSIRDNGIGIDPNFIDKIFGIFQRLHNHDEYEGTGIGLSIAKKHVEFLGGRIWVESVPGVGSTFYFTVAK